MIEEIHDEDELRVLQKIRSLTKADFVAMERASEASGDTEGLRKLFEFGLSEAGPEEGNRITGTF